MNPNPHTALISLLEQEEAIYDEMAGLLDEERQALLDMAVTRLGEITARKETLALRVKALDESRKLLARRLGAALELSPEAVTLSALAAAAPPESAAPLRAAGERLRRTVERCQKSNDFNARAAARGMSLARDAIEFMISQADPTGRLYAAPRGRAGAYGPPTRSGAPGFISRQI